MDFYRRKIRFIEGNSKLTCKGTLRQVFICLRPRTPCIQYTYSHREEEEEESWTREKVRGGTVHKAGSKMPTWLIISPVYKLWWPPVAKSLLHDIFLDDDILLWSLYSELVYDFSMLGTSWAVQFPPVRQSTAQWEENRSSQIISRGMDKNINTERSPLFFSVANFQ